MSSIVIVLSGLIAMSCGWFLYSRVLSNFVFKLDKSFVTPAHQYQDGIDFVPTKKWVLWGHHFTSIAGAAPIVGPAIAIYWGWLPALLWIVFGTVFFAGMHDMGALWASNRNKGQSIGLLSESVIGKRTRSLFMVVTFLLLLMVNSVFAVVIAKSFISSPQSVFPAWSAIVVAVAIGLMLRRNMSLVMVTIVGVVLLYVSVWFGANNPMSITSVVNFEPQATWIVVLFAYAAIASLLPVWLLLQPRDFINGAQLIIGLILLYGAVIISSPELTAPMLNNAIAKDTPSIIPLLFVTIACGAVSGFHGIVASGTSSKQLDKETDARFVGYLGALGEGALALITLVVVSSVSLAMSAEEWHQIYHQFGEGGAQSFIQGGAKLIEQGWGIPKHISNGILAVMVVLFAGTTMDSGVRLQRYIMQEWGQIYSIKILNNRFVATFLVVLACLLLSFGSGDSTGAGAMKIWPLFGSTNQILASLTLLVLTVILMKLGRPFLYVLLPMLFIFSMSILSSLFLLMKFVQRQEYFLAVMILIVIAVSICVILEASGVVKKLHREKLSA